MLLVRAKLTPRSLTPFAQRVSAKCPPVHETQTNGTLSLVARKGAVAGASDSERNRPPNGHEASARTSCSDRPTASRASALSQ